MKSSKAAPHNKRQIPAPNEFRNSPRSGGPGKWGDANLKGFLSLNLLLLAFFILLNARSTYEAIKVNAVLESVYRAFNGRVLVETNLSTQSAAIGPLEQATFFIDKLGRLFDSMVPAVYRENTPRGPVMVLELSETTIFRPGEATLQPGRQLFLARLVETLRERPSPLISYRFEVLHGLTGGDGTKSLQAFRRMSALAEYLVQQGVPLENLSIGTYATDQARVRFIFRVFETPSHDASGSSPAADSGRQR